MALMPSRVSSSTEDFRLNREAYLARVADLQRRRSEASAGGPERARRLHKQRKQLLPRERVERLEEARQELEKIRAAKPDAESKVEARASETEPQARMMKQGDGGYAPSYNVQLSTEASNGCIVGVGRSQSGSDYRELPAAMERVREQAGKRPAQVVVDGGFTTGATRAIP